MHNYGMYKCAINAEIIMNMEELYSQIVLLSSNRVELIAILAAVA